MGEKASTGVAIRGWRAPDDPHIRRRRGPDRGDVHADMDVDGRERRAVIVNDGRPIPPEPHVLGTSDPGGEQRLLGSGCNRGERRSIEPQNTPAVARDPYVVRAAPRDPSI